MDEERPVRLGLEGKLVDLPKVTEPAAARANRANTRRPATETEGGPCLDG